MKNSAFLVVLLVAFSTGSARKVSAQAAVTPNVVVTGAEIPSAYGAPASFSGSRVGTISNAYVLPPGEVYTSLIYEGDAVHFRKPDHNFTQEIEVGLPWRINLAVENSVETFGGTTQERSFSFEARYALADWGKIPLNPTIFAEYKVGGLGKILHDEGPPTPPNKFGPGGFDTTMDTPDAYEVRLLLSDEFFGRIEWALNGFFEQELTGDRGREWGLAQSIVTPLFLPREQLKVGVEMQFRSFTDKGIRGTPYNSFVIGPAVGWRPTRNTRIDVAPLFGVNHKSPQVQAFVVLSYLFGGGGEHETEAPASTRNR